jgi:hypothetical protein
VFEGAPKLRIALLHVYLLVVIVRRLQRCRTAHSPLETTGYHKR